MITLVAAISALALAPVQQPSLALADRRVLPGTSVNLAGRQLPDRPIVVKLAGARDTTTLATAVPGAGSIAVELRIPGSLAPGAYRLLAVADGRSVASLDIAVLERPADSLARRATPAPAPSHPSGHEMPESTVVVQEPPGTSLGYDWPRLHAAVNDLPAALLLFALLCEVAAVLTGSATLRAAGYWGLMAGVAGLAAAVVAGLMAENRVAHDDIAHEVMNRHKTLALVSGAVFVGLGAWRFMRRHHDRRAERLVWSGCAAIGAALLVAASQLGGSLVFDHALGVPSATLRTVLERRGDFPVMVMGDSAGMDSVSAAKAGAPHRDRPGAAPHAH